MVCSEFPPPSPRLGDVDEKLTVQSESQAGTCGSTFANCTMNTGTPDKVKGALELSLEMGP